MEETMQLILFQGDSITDCGRSRERDDLLGDGYPLLVTAELAYRFSEQYRFLNRGISGNRVVDLYARIKADIINLKPDYISILIGVNDVWHELSDNPNGVDAEKFEKIYSMLIEEIQMALPNVKIVILEPFVLEATATKNTEDEPKRWDIFNSEVKKRAEKARIIAKKYNLPFVPLQEKFDEASKQTENAYWLRDGVHPTAAGHEIIKREWLKTFEQMMR